MVVLQLHTLLSRDRLIIPGAGYSSVPLCYSQEHAMSLLICPIEVILLMAGELAPSHQSDLAALVWTCQRLYQSLNLYLYQYTVR